MSRSGVIMSVSYSEIVQPKKNVCASFSFFPLCTHTHYIGMYICVYVTIYVCVYIHSRKEEGREREIGGAFGEKAKQRDVFCRVEIFRNKQLRYRAGLPFSPQSQF